MRNITVQYQKGDFCRILKILVPQMDTDQKVCQQGQVRVACRGRPRAPCRPLTARLGP